MKEKMQIPIQYSPLTSVQPAFQTSENITYGWCPVSKVIGNNFVRYQNAGMAFGACPSQFIDTVDTDISCIPAEYHYDSVEAVSLGQGGGPNLGGLQAPGGEVPNPFFNFSESAMGNSGQKQILASTVGRDSSVSFGENISYANLKRDPVMYRNTLPMRGWFRRHGSYLSQASTNENF